MIFNRLLALSLLLAVVFCDPVPINGNTDLGTAYDLNYYASVGGLQITLARTFNDPNTKGQCSDGQTEYQASSDITCAFNGYGGASGSSVNTSQDTYKSFQDGSGFGGGFFGFQTTVNTEFDNSYFYESNYASVQDSGLYHYYTLSMDWKKRGLTSEFTSDAKGKDDTCSLCEKYGYYFLVAGQYGGEYQYTQSESYSYYNSSSSMQTNISGGFEDFTASNNFGQHSSGSSSTSFSQYYFTYQGCDYQCLQSGSSCSWVDSCKTNPALYDFIGSDSFVSIEDVYTYYGFKDRASDAAACIQTYLNSFTPVVFTSVVTTTPLTNLTTGIVGQVPLLCQPSAADQGNGFVTSITFGAIDGLGVESIQCQNSFLVVNDPGAQNFFFATSQTEQPNNYGDVFLTVEVPQGEGIIGLSELSYTDKCSARAHEGPLPKTDNNTVLASYFGRPFVAIPADEDYVPEVGGPEKQCTYICGYKWYTASMNLHSSAAPFVGSFNSNGYQLMLSDDCPWTNESTAKIAPANNVATAVALGNAGVEVTYAPLTRVNNGDSN